MLNPQIRNKFRWQWVLINTVSLPFGLVLSFLFPKGLGYVIPESVFQSEQINIFFVSLTIPAAIVGLGQWLALRSRISRISIGWILTTIPGLYIGLFVAYIAFFVALATQDWLNLYDFDKFADRLDIVIVGCILGGTGGAVGGLITGFIQSLLLADKIFYRSLLIIWMKTATLAWAVSWSVSWAILSFFGEPVDFTSPFLEIILGTICGGLDGAITGRVLVRVLRRSSSNQKSE